MTTSHAQSQPRLVRLPLQPPALMVLAAEHPCPYLPGKVARLRMREPLLPVSQEGMEWTLAQGERRQGQVLYSPQCNGCQACQPIRLDLLTFRPSQQQIRAHRTGVRRLDVQVGRPEVDAERVALFNHHKTTRGLDDGGEPVTDTAYAHFLVDTCCDSWELRYRCKTTGRLLGIAIVDRSARALSAVYCYYDPTVPGLSIGVFSVLEELALAQRLGLRWLYLGYYIEQCRAMRYKASYLPHEIREPQTGQWRLHTDLAGQNPRQNPP
jgi:arginine-tRNA-protein transferase